MGAFAGCFLRLGWVICATVGVVGTTALVAFSNPYYPIGAWPVIALASMFAGPSLLAGAVGAVVQAATRSFPRKPSP